MEDKFLQGRMSAMQYTEGVDREVLHPGCVIDRRYRLIEKLGEGGMGVVFLAEHLPLARRVALKTLKVGRGADLTHQKRLEREARVGSSVQHENVARILDAGHLDSGRPYFVLEWVDGIELSRLIAQEGALGVDQCVQLMIQVARGVAAAHAQGVSHRDLKPHNVMVLDAQDGKPRVKVLDFGLSKWDDDHAGADATMSLTDTGFIGGTPQYMAPEMIRGECSGSRAADVYAIGAIFYELLGGGRLHEGASPNAILYSVLSKTPTPIGQRVPGLPAPITDLVQRAISKEPESRPDAGAFVAELEAFVARSSISEPLPSRGPIVGRDKAMRFVLRTVLAAATALGVVFALGLFLGMRGLVVAPQLPRTTDQLERPMDALADAAVAEAGPRDVRSDPNLAPFISNEAPATEVFHSQATSPVEIPREPQPLRNENAHPAARSVSQQGVRPQSVSTKQQPESLARQNGSTNAPAVVHRGAPDSPITATAAQEARPLAGFVTENPYD